MPVNIGLADLSNLTLVLAVALYALAMLGYAGDLAFGTRARIRLIRFPELARAGAAAGNGHRSAAGAAAGQDAAADAEATVGAGAGVGVRSGSMAGNGAAPGGAPGLTAAVGSQPGTAAAAARRLPGAAVPQGGSPRQSSGSPGPARAGLWPQGQWLRAAFALTCAGLAAHVVSILSRGLAEHRTPWGNMYEFIAAVCCMAVLVLVAASVRFRAYYTGLFVLLPVVLALALDITVVYTPAGQLVPALQSYWIAIHVTAMILATGLFMFGAIVTVMYLLADRHERRGAAGHESRYGGILDRLPGAITFDRLAYRSILFAFPTWMFAIFAGAMWANEAWGRPWGWDPKETWSLITLLVYAGFLHARATAGWRGRRAAWIQLAGFGCLLFNLVGINLWVSGLHSYAGLH